MNIDIKEWIEHTDTGDIFRIEFDQFKYYIKLYIDEEDLSFYYELRNSNGECQGGDNNFKQCIEDARNQVVHDVKKFLKEHFGVNVND